MLEFLINDFWHMIFCKFDQSTVYIYIPIWKSSWTSLNRGICAKRANQYGSHVGFCVDKHILFKKLVMEIYSRFHGPENIKLPVCGIYVDKFNIIKYWWSK